MLLTDITADDDKIPHAPFLCFFFFFVTTQLHPPSPPQSAVAAISDACVLQEEAFSRLFSQSLLQLL